MEIKEVDRKISKYTGREEKYSESLDAQVPAWEKLKVTRITIYPRVGEDGKGAIVEVQASSIHTADFSETIAEAAARATVKLIRWQGK